MKPSIPLLILLVAGTGCASVAISDEAIVERTAFALGLPKSDFTVSQRSDDGPTARYQVRTKSGQEFNCSVGGSISVLGRQVTDALCHRKGEPARNPLLR